MVICIGISARLGMVRMNIRLAVHGWYGCALYTMNEPPKARPERVDERIRHASGRWRGYHHACHYAESEPVVRLAPPFPLIQPRNLCLAPQARPDSYALKQNVFNGFDTGFVQVTLC